MNAYREYPHAPSHLFVSECTYIVTAGTLGKAHFFNTPEKRDMLLQHLQSGSQEFGWELQAWAVMANHYHFVATAPENPETLPKFLRSLHSKTAIQANRIDATPGRKVWWQYWDTCLTNERSYFARLRYVHSNPVRHGLVDKAEKYPWCSMSWFLREAENGFRKQILSFDIDRVSVRDDF